MKILSLLGLALLLTFLGSKVSAEETPLAVESNAPNKNITLLLTNGNTTLNSTFSTITSASPTISANNGTTTTLNVTQSMSETATTLNVTQSMSGTATTLNVTQSMSVTTKKPTDKNEGGTGKDKTNNVQTSSFTSSSTGSSTSTSTTTTTTTESPTTTTATTTTTTTTTTESTTSTTTTTTTSAPVVKVVENSPKDASQDWNSGSDAGAKSPADLNPKFSEQSGGSSHFFVFACIGLALCIALYLAYQSRSKLLAFLIEGRRPPRGRSRQSSGSRDRSKVSYRPLSTNATQDSTNKGFIY